MFFILFFVSTWMYDILVNGSYIHEEYLSSISGLNNIYDIIILVELVLSDNYSALIDTNSDCSLDIVDIVDIVSITLDN